MLAPARIASSSFARIARIQLRSPLVALTSASPSIRGFSTDEITNGEGTLFSAEKLFTERFDYKHPNRTLQAPIGSYVSLSQDERDKFFPEGFAGEIDEEFEHSGDSRWMVRDTDKFLCRMIEAIEAKGGAGKQSNSSAKPSPSIINSPLHVSKITDRPEWHDGLMRMMFYGQELKDRSKISLKASADRTVEKPDGDLAEEYAAKVLQRCNDESHALPDKILLSGPRGVGKSVALNQAVLYARKRGWLCFFVPSAWRLVQEGPYVEPLLHDPQQFDNPLESVELLRGFWRAHHSQLQDIPIEEPVADEILEKYSKYQASFKESWNRELAVQLGSVSGSRKSNASASSKLFSFIEMRGFVLGEDHFPELDEPDRDILADFDYMNFKLRTLEDLVLLGIALRDLSGSICVDVIERLKELETIPVLFAVDQYNCWEVTSAFSYDDKPLIGKNDLCVPKALHFISTKKAEGSAWKIKNGLCIAATSMRHPEGNRVSFTDERKSIPLNITVPCFSQVEFLSAVSYYVHRRILTESVLGVEGVLALRMHTQSNPRLLRLEGVPFIMPRIMLDLHPVFEDVVELSQYESNRLNSAGGYDSDSADGDAAGAEEVDAVDAFLNDSSSSSSSSNKGGRSTSVNSRRKRISG